MSSNRGGGGVHLYGRDDLVQRLARSEVPVTLLLGDSGIGKSAVLEAAQVQRSQNAIAPLPRTVTRSGGVLQNGLLQSLADSVALIIDQDGNVEQVASVLVDAAKRLAEDRGQELAKVIGRELLTFVQARLGTGVGDAIGAYVAK